MESLGGVVSDICLVTHDHIPRLLFSAEASVWKSVLSGLQTRFCAVHKYLQQTAGLALTLLLGDPCTRHHWLKTNNKQGLCVVVPPACELALHWFPEQGALFFFAPCWL